jgi:hypothetical protein
VGNVRWKPTNSRSICFNKKIDVLIKNRSPTILYFLYFIYNDCAIAFFLGTNKSSLVIQVRTTKVGDTNATGFTGIAVQEGNSEVVQVNLRSAGNPPYRFEVFISNGLFQIDR